MATSNGDNGLTKSQITAKEKRRNELFDFVRKIDPDKIHELTIRTGAAPSPDQFLEDFHKYFFRGSGRFTNSWTKIMDAPNPDTHD